MNATALVELAAPVQFSLSVLVCQRRRGQEVRGRTEEGHKKQSGTGRMQFAINSGP